MQTASGTLVLRNGQLVDGNGGPPVPDAALVIADGRIHYAGPAAAAPAVPPQTPTIDACGGTIMPGLVEAHFHPTYFNVAALEDLDIKYPVEYVTLLAASNARLALECGYTAARSGGSLFNIDVWLKKAIENGVTVGPRLAASGREICGAAGLMDWNPDYRKIGMEGLVLIVNGPDEARAAVRKLVKDGVEWVKTYPTGDAAAPDANDHHTLCMTFEEMHAVVQTAHNHGLKVTGHCRATEGIKNALRAGYDAIEHGTFIDDEGLELLLAHDVPCVPALYFEQMSVERGPEFGLGKRVIAGHQETLEGGAESGTPHPTRGRATRHGGRLRLRLESARRLRERAEFLRRVRRPHAAGSSHLRHPHRRTNHGPRRRIRHARTGQTRRHPHPRRQPAPRHPPPPRPQKIHSGHASRHRQIRPPLTTGGLLIAREREYLATTDSVPFHINNYLNRKHRSQSRPATDDVATLFISYRPN
ncbi:MAG: amidohydrolase family protein [Pirellulales bacterium]